MRCDSWGLKELDMTEGLNRTELNTILTTLKVFNILMEIIFTAISYFSSPHSKL